MPRPGWPPPAPACPRCGASGRGRDRLDLDRVETAHHAVHPRHLHLGFDELLELRVLRIAGLGAHRDVDRAVARQDSEWHARLGARLRACLMAGAGLAVRGEAVQVDHLAGDRHLVACGGSVALRRERSEEHTSELQSQSNLVCRLLLEKKKDNTTARSLESNHYSNW